MLEIRPTPSAGAVARPQDIVRVQRPSPRVYSRPAPASLRLRRCEVLGAVLRDAECAAAPGSNIDQDAREAARLVAEVRGQRYSEASPALMMQASLAVLRFALAECNNGKDIFGNLMESPTEVPSVRPCASCGERLHVMRWPLLIDGAPVRILGQCDSCGITVDDVEEGSAHLGATFDFEGGRLVLPEGLRRPGVCVGLMLRTWRRDIATWVLDADAAYGPPIGAFGPGVTTACVLAVDALEVTFLTQLIRSPW